MAHKKASAKKDKNKHSGKRRRIALIIGMVAGALVLVAGFWGYTTAYKNKILPNIKVGGINIGGLSVEAAQARLEEAGKKVTDGSVSLHIGDKNFKESASILGIGYKYNESAQEAYELGHGNSKLENLWLSTRALLGPIYLSPNLSDGTEQITGWIGTVALEVDDPLQNANLEIRNETAFIIEPKDGNQIDQPGIIARIIESVAYFTAPDLTVERETAYPQITKQDAQDLAEEAKTLIKDSLVLTVDGRKFTLYPNNLGEWIKLKIGSKEKDNKKYVSFDEIKIRSYLDENIAPSVNRQPRDAKFAFSGGTISVIQNSVPGSALNSEKTAEGIVKLLENKDTERKMAITLEEQPAKINEAVVKNVAKYGIKEQIGSATTGLGKSPQNRIHNIKTGADLLNGVLIAPGEEFSTIGHLGSISGASGFLPELVIKEDRTVPEFGGGLCQVSTTLFRAALNTGLKITDRTNHSYRVSYYEPPIGMDATIYSPRPDLKFINNTPAYILVQSSASSSSVTFNFYGTSDGRKVTISEPEKYDETPPGDAIYVEDPSMEPGTERYLEHAHAGAKAIFYYKVFNSSGALKLEQTFRSVYVPWPSRIVRGPEKPPEEAGGDQPQ